MYLENVSFVESVVNEFVIHLGAVNVEFGRFMVLAADDKTLSALVEVGDVTEAIVGVRRLSVQVLLVLVPMLLHVLVPCCR